MTFLLFYILDNNDASFKITFDIFLSLQKEIFTIILFILRSEKCLHVQNQFRDRCVHASAGHFFKIQPNFLKFRAIRHLLHDTESL